MDAKIVRPATVDEYISTFPEDMQSILQKVRNVVREAAPDAQEKISYNMAGYFLEGWLVWFGGFKNHVGMYPITDALEPIRQELSAFKQTKGGIQIPYKKPIPYALIGRMVKLLVEDQKAKGK